MNIMIQTNLTSQIHDAQLEAIKIRNVKFESLRGIDAKFIVKENGTKYFMDRI